MEERRVASFTIDVFADKATAKDVVAGVLHTIFWYRIFANLEPTWHDILEVSVPWIQDVDLQTLLEQRVDYFVRQIDADCNDQSQNTRGQIVVQFSERERRRKKGWFGAKDEDLVWETWTLNIALASPRTHQGRQLSH
jgi:autophagy-related protein 101